MEDTKNSSVDFIITRLPDQTDTFLRTYSVLLALVAFGGVVGNFTVIWKMATVKTLRTVPNMLSTMVSFNLLIQSSVELPLQIYLNSLLEGDILPDAVCLSLVWLQMAADLSCILLMSEIAVNKWAAVTKDPSCYSRLFSLKPAGISALIIVIFSNGLIFAFQILAKARHEYINLFLTCGLKAAMDDAIMRANFFILFALYATGITISVLSYASIACYFRQAQKRLQARRTLVERGRVTTAYRKNQREKWRVYSLCAINAVLFITWLPFITIATIHLQPNVAISSLIAVGTVLLCISKVVLFPVYTLYVFSNMQK